jgi:ElaB/YqjD/DUF883 family membrane-anchored ribosome-binding protein
MSEVGIEGGADVGVGEARSFAGEVMNDPGQKAKGAGRKLEGRIKQTAGQLEGLIGQTADTASAAVVKLSDRAAQAANALSEQAKRSYEKASAQAKRTAETVDPFVHERPYASLGIAAAAGLIVGLLLAARGPKVIYIKSRV